LEYIIIVDRYNKI